MSYECNLQGYNVMSDMSENIQEQVQCSCPQVMCLMNNKNCLTVSPWCHLFIVNIVCIHYVNKTHLLFQLPVHTLSSVAHYIPLFTNVAYTLCYMDVMSCCVFCSHINSTLLYYALSHCSISLCIISFCNLDNLGNKAYEIF